MKGPLDDRTIVVTRATEQAGRLVSRLTELGARVVEAPTIGIADPLDGGAALTAAVHALDRYDWVVLTSPNGVDRFLRAAGGRVFRGKVAAVATEHTIDGLVAAVVAVLSP